MSEGYLRLKRRRRVRRMIAVPVMVALVLVAAGAWLAHLLPSEDVPPPGPDATPEQVFSAYVRAIAVRDFDTANALDARPGSDLGLFSHPLTMQNVRDEEWVVNDDAAHVVFSADYDNGDGSLEDGDEYGFQLRRDPDGRWRIIGAVVNHN